MTNPNACAVLFVDDEPLVLQGLQRMLRNPAGGLDDAVRGERPGGPQPAGARSL